MPDRPRALSPALLPHPAAGEPAPPARDERAFGARHLLGLSEEGRPIYARHLGDPAAALRVLVVAGQHGDEASAREAARAFSRRCRPPSGVRLAVVADANPDGAALGTRGNAHGVDLNRDHLLLRSAETQALHHLVRAWRPHLVIDVHTYPPRRKHLLKDNLIYCHEVFVDVATNPAVAHPVWISRRPRFLDNVLPCLHERGVRSARYTLVNASGRVRHSTPDVMDARNGLALRYGCFAVLLEGRRPVRTDTAYTASRLRAVLVTTLEAVVAWAKRHRRALTAPCLPVRRDRWVTVDSGYARADSPCSMLFENAATGALEPAVLPGKYTPHLKAKRRVRLPLAYAVPDRCQALLGVLRRHGLPHHRAAPGHVRHVERTWIQHVRPSTREHRAPRRLSTGLSRERRALPGYTLFPVTRVTGPALAVFLEAASKYGLYRFEEVDLALEPRAAYPVLRVTQ